MGYGLPVFLIYVLYWELGNTCSFVKLSKCFYENGIDWDYVIAQQAQASLVCFALFTQVKGVSNSVKRRAYLILS